MVWEGVAVRGRWELSGPCRTGSYEPLGQAPVDLLHSKCRRCRAVLVAAPSSGGVQVDERITMRMLDWGERLAGVRRVVAFTDDERLFG